METAYTVYIRGCVKTFMSYVAGYPYVKCTKYTRNSMWSGFGALVVIKGDLSATPFKLFWRQKCASDSIQPRDTPADLEETLNPIKAASCRSGGTPTVEEGGVFTGKTTGHKSRYVRRR